MRKIALFLICLSFLFPLQVVEGGYYYARGSAVSGNDFSSDSDCMALWRFESGALTTDSKGTNTLTDHETVEENITDYKEGACSADFELDYSEYFSIPDADLDADYPLKSGDANKKISVCGWFRLEALPSATGNPQYLYAKYDTGADKRTFAITVAPSTDKMQLLIGHTNGTLADTHEHASALSAGIWYHYGVTWQDSDKSYRVRIWDDNAGAILGVDKTGIGGHPINIEDAIVTIGARADGLREVDGEKDEVVICKDILAAAEIDKIRAGIYP